MASLMDKLRAMAGFAPKGGNGASSKADPADSFGALSEQFLAAQDDVIRAQLWAQMCKELPDTLFLAAMCYEGEDPNAPVRDRDLHATAGAKRLYASRQHVVTKGNPGYSLAKKEDSRHMRLRTIIYNQSKEEWVPLFTDFDKLLPVFGRNYRVTLISFAEARQIAKPYQGIVINPGKHSIRLDNSQLKKAL